MQTTSSAAYSIQKKRKISHKTRDAAHTNKLVEDASWHRAERTELAKWSPAMVQSTGYKMGRRERTKWDDQEGGGRVDMSSRMTAAHSVLPFASAMSKAVIPSILLA